MFVIKSAHRGKFFLPTFLPLVFTQVTEIKEVPNSCWWNTLPEDKSHLISKQSELLISLFLLFCLRAPPEERVTDTVPEETHPHVSELRPLPLFSASLCTCSLCLWVVPITLPAFSPRILQGHQVCHLLAFGRRITPTHCPTSSAQHRGCLMLLPGVNVSAILPCAIAPTITFPLRQSSHLSMYLQSPLTASLSSSCLYSQHVLSSFISTIMSFVSRIVLEISFYLTV